MIASGPAGRPTSCQTPFTFQHEGCFHLMVDCMRLPSMHSSLRTMLRIVAMAHSMFEPQKQAIARRLRVLDSRMDNTCEMCFTAHAALLPGSCYSGPSAFKRKNSSAWDDLNQLRRDCRYMPDAVKTGLVYPVALIMTMCANEQTISSKANPSMSLCRADISAETFSSVCSSSCSNASLLYASSARWTIAKHEKT